MLTIEQIISLDCINDKTKILINISNKDYKHSFYGTWFSDSILNCICNKDIADKVTDFNYSDKNLLIINIKN